jgi:hypothetical protein
VELRAALEQRAKKWEPVFCKKRCANKEIEQDADPELTHLALVWVLKQKKAPTSVEAFLLSWNAKTLFRAEIHDVHTRNFGRQWLHCHIDFNCSLGILVRCDCFKATQRATGTCRDQATDDDVFLQAF